MDAFSLVDWIVNATSWDRAFQDELRGAARLPLAQGPAPSEPASGVFGIVIVLVLAGTGYALAITYARKALDEFNGENEKRLEQQKFEASVKAPSEAPETAALKPRGITFEPPHLSEGAWGVVALVALSVVMLFAAGGDINDLIYGLGRLVFIGGLMVAIGWIALGFRRR